MTLKTRTARRQIWALLSVYMASMLNGSAEGWLTNVVYLLTVSKEAEFSAAEWSWISSSNLLGKIIFAIPAGILADKFGQKIFLTISGVVRIVAWLLLATSMSLPVICVARFILGLNYALVHAVALPTIGEIASPHIRGTLAGLFQTFSYFGNLLQAVLSVLFSSYRLLAYCNLALSLVYFATLATLLETPNYLLKVSNYDKAEKNLRFIRPTSTNDQITEEFQQLKQYMEKENIKRDHWYQILSVSSVMKPLTLAVTINFFIMLFGNNVINTYITLIIPENEYIPRRYCPSIIIIMSFLSISCSSAIIDKFPRRIMYMFGAAFACIMLTSISCSYYLHTYRDVKWCLWIFICGNLFFRVYWAGVLLPVNCAVRSEIFPQNVKGIGNAFCTIAQNTATIITYKLYEFITQNYDLHYLYLIFATNCVILFTIIFLCLPEGHGKSLQDLQSNDGKVSSKEYDKKY